MFMLYPTYAIKITFKSIKAEAVLASKCSLFTAFNILYTAKFCSCENSPEFHVQAHVNKVWLCMY